MIKYIWVGIVAKQQLDDVWETFCYGEVLCCLLPIKCQCEVRVSPMVQKKTDDFGRQTEYSAAQSSPRFAIA